MRKRVLGAGLVMALVVEGGGKPSVAQEATWGFDSGLASHYVWRGVTRRNAFVWQSDLYGAVAVGPSYLTVGGWGSVELTKAAAALPDDLGYGQRLGEYAPWVEWSLHVGELDAALGVTRTFFDDDIDPALNPLFGNRTELYGRFAVHPGRFSVGARGWHAVEDDATPRHTTYLEGRASGYVPVLPIGITVLRFGTTVGWQSNSPYHAEGRVGGSGLTHWDLYTEAQLSTGLLGLQLYVLPALHVQVNVDDATRQTRGERAAVDPGSGVKAWFGFTISYQRQ